MTDNLGYKKGMAFLQASEHVCGEKLVCSSRSCILVISLRLFPQFPQITY